jgi:hypothetical protein
MAYRPQAPHNSNYYDGVREAAMKRAKETTLLRPLIDESKPKRLIQNTLSPDLEVSVCSKLRKSVDASFLQSKFMQKQGETNLLVDGFNHWYADNKQYNINPDKYWWHHLLSKVDNHLLQYATNNKAGYSFIASKHIVSLLERLYREYGDNMEEHMDKLNEECGNGEGQGDFSSDSSVNSEDYKAFKESVEKGTTKAYNKIKKDLSDTAKQGGDQMNGSGAGALESAELFSSPEIKRLGEINKGTLKNFFKTTIDKATSNAVGKQSLIEESFFDSEDIEEIVNIENFAHIAMFEDLVTKASRYNISFDIYIDDSGSMSSTFYIDGKSMSYRNLAHLVAYRLNQLKLLRDCYLFGSTRQLIKIPITELFSFKYGGGTDIDQCLQNAKAVNRPCIVITDGSDALNEKNYFKDAFLLTLEVPYLNNTFEPYVKQGQVLGYSGGKLSKYSINNKPEDAYNRIKLADY